MNQITTMTMTRISTASNPKKTNKHKNASSPILSICHRTRAAARVFEQIYARLGIARGGAKGSFCVCIAKGGAGLGRPVKLDKHLRPALGVGACMHVCVPA